MGMDSPPQDGQIAQCPDQRAGSIGFIEDPIEIAVEHDLSLVPTGPSALLVEPAVLDEQEVQALLCGLSQALQSAADAAATAILNKAYPDDSGSDHQEHSDESHSPATRRDRGHSKL